MFLSITEYLLNCPFKKHLGIECFGCGFQRSVVLLTEGKFLESIKMYPATLPMFCLWAFVAAHLYFKFEHGARVIQFAFIFCTLIIITHFIYKLIYGTT